MVQKSSVIKPPALRPGDAVAVVAPASNLKADYLARGVAELERLGFRVKYEPGILDKTLYTAGDDKRRANELMRAFADPEIKAVWAARGGYGSMRLFKLLDENLIGRRPKISRSVDGKIAYPADDTAGAAAYGRLDRQPTRRAGK